MLIIRLIFDLVQHSNEDFSEILPTSRRIKYRILKFLLVKIMETYTVEILEPKAKKLLDDLENLNLCLK